jgi:hypothetical protein
MKPDVAVVIMAKVPRSGRTKTRLAGALCPQEASDLYAAMLRDRCAWLRAMPGVVRAIAFAEWHGDGPPPDLVPEGFDAVPQPPGDLGAGRRSGRALPRPRPLGRARRQRLAHPAALAPGGRGPAAPARRGRLRGGAVRRRRVLPARAAPAVPRPLHRDAVEHRSGGSHHPRARRRGRPARERAAGVVDVDTPADLDRLERTLHQAWWPSHTAEWLRCALWCAHDPAAIVSRPSSGAPWARLSSRAVYATPWLRIREDRVQCRWTRDHHSLVDAGRCGRVVHRKRPRRAGAAVPLHRRPGEPKMPTGGVARRDPGAARRQAAEEAGVVPNGSIRSAPTTPARA